MENKLKCIDDKSIIFHASYEDWGVVLYIMEKQGHAVARMYIYKDDIESAYLVGLNVNEECRKQGIGTHIINAYEEIALHLDITSSYLSVEKDEWMHDWYKRLGYEDIEIDKDVSSRVWMHKQLKKGETK